MTTNLKGKNIELTADIRNYLDRRLDGIGKFVPEGEAVVADVELARVTKHQTGDVFLAEINIQVNGRIFNAKSERSELFEAIDNIKDEIIRELVSYKKKRLSLLKRGGQKIKNLIRGFSSRGN